MNFDWDTFGLTSKDVRQLDERTFHVHKWEWPYEKAHAFQRATLKRLDENPRERWLITCNHPRVLTNGRGLQKPRKGEDLSELKEFDPAQHTNLLYPFYQIERGGGLTFHHTGQFIFYPILKLNPKSLSLSRMIDDIFDTAACVLTDWGISGLSHSEKMLGLWYGPRKIASMGIAIEKLTTFHGMALNLYQDPEMMKVLKELNPCGLSSEVYIAAEEIIKLGEKDLNLFKDEFIQRIMHGWQ